MKLYSAKAPSAYRVKVFLQEKNLELPTQMVQVLERETRRPEFLLKNSLAEVPVLELDDGSYLTESVAICRYLEALHPEPSLLGRTPLEVARIEMWNRRMEQQIMTPVGEVGRHTFTLFADKIEQVPAYAESQKRLQSRRWQWLDESLADGRTYVCDDRFSLADITGMTALVISGFAGLEVPAGLHHVRRWSDAVRARPSWEW